MDSIVIADSQKSNNMKALFEPKSIAVIGASRRKDAVGYAVLHNLLEGGFSGGLYPVNPKADEIDGVACFKSLEDVKESIDLAVIIVPSKYVPGVMQQCADRDVKAVIVISAGFREVGPEGRALEDEVVEIAREHNIALLGPNCLGLINTDPNYSINASFSRFMPKSGNIGFISQSGALCAAILDYVKGKNIGFSKFISLGNKAAINEVSLLSYLRDDPHTEVILLYLEDIVEGHEFMKLAKEVVQNKKPILAMKSGRTMEGAKAASSHTGSMMGSDEVYDAIFEQSGVLRLESVADIFNYGVAFSYQPLPKSNRVAIVTNAGGPGIIVTDACVRNGIKIASFDQSTNQLLKECLPVTASYNNPVDVIGDAQQDRYEKVLKVLSKDDNIDGIIIILTPQSMTNIDEIAKVIVDASKKTDKTVLVSFMGGVDVASGVALIEENNIPHYIFPEDAARTFAAMVAYREWLERPHFDTVNYDCDVVKAKEVIDRSRKEGKKFLTIDQSMDIFKAYGLPILPYGVAQSSEEAISVAGDIKYPVVLKVISQDIIHKVDAGGVVINIQDKDELREAYDNMLSSIEKSNPEAKIDGFFIQKQGKKGKEVILGMHRDEHFGPIIMFGMGGIYVEALKDVSFRLAPIQVASARHMIQSIKTYPILKGVRGESPVDFDNITECLIRLSQLACNHPEIQEIDVNPLVAYSEGDGCAVLDARIIL